MGNPIFGLFSVGDFTSMYISLTTWWAALITICDSTELFSLLSFTYANISLLSLSSCPLCQQRSTITYKFLFPSSERKNATSSQALQRQSGLHMWHFLAHSLDSVKDSVLFSCPSWSWWPGLQVSCVLEGIYHHLDQLSFNEAL